MAASPTCHIPMSRRLIASNNMVDGVNYGGEGSGVDNNYDICDVCAKSG